LSSIEGGEGSLSIARRQKGLEDLLAGSSQGGLEGGEESRELVLGSGEGGDVARHEHVVEGLPLGEVEDGEDAATYQEVGNGGQGLAGVGAIAEGMAHHGLRHQFGPGLQMLVGGGGGGRVEEEGKGEEEDGEEAGGGAKREMEWWHGGCWSRGKRKKG
jgi:hypothetical protein